MAKGFARNEFNLRDNTYHLTNRLLVLVSGSYGWRMNIWKLIFITLRNWLIRSGLFVLGAIPLKPSGINPCEPRMILHNVWAYSASNTASLSEKQQCLCWKRWKSNPMYSIRFDLYIGFMISLTIGWVIDCEFCIWKTW